MAIAASSHLASFVAWQFLPSALAKAVLSSFYSVFPSRRPTVPPNAPPAQLAYENARATRHATRARVLLVAAYLAYTIVSAYLAQARGYEQNFYALLQLDRDVVEAGGPAAVKSHWRKLARVYHPDKVGKGGEELFVVLRRGVETLESEGRRWAYERWGPEMLDWGRLVTQREFLARGIQQTAMFYVFAFASLVVLGFFRKEERNNSFWRYLFLLSALTAEVHLTLRGHSPSSLLQDVFPARLPFEHIALVRQAFLSASMALSQLGPLLFPPSDGEEDPLAQAQREAALLGPTVQRLAQAVAAAEVEVRAMQEMELRPLVGGGGAGKDVDKGRVVEEVKGAMERTFEDLQVKGGEGTRQVWVRAVQRGRGREVEVLPSLNGAGLMRVKVEGEEEEAGGPKGGLRVAEAEAAGRLPTPPPDV